MRWIRGGAAALTLVAGTLGAPIALAAWGHYPADLSAIRADDGSALLLVLTGVGWLAWGAFVVATAAELLTQVTGRTRRVPGLTGVQQLAGGLLVLVITALPITRLTAASAPSPVAVSKVETGPTTLAHDTEASTAAQPKESHHHAEEATYVISPGDDLWSLAERLLGDGRRWRELTALNPRLTDPVADLLPGTTLLVPRVADTFSAAEAKPESAQLTVTVRKGDTLSALAQEHLGAAAKWPKIAAANHIISDPDHIEIGWRLRIPRAQPPDTASPEQTLDTARATPSRDPGLRSVRHDVDTSAAEAQEIPSASATPDPAQTPTATDTADDIAPANPDSSASGGSFSPVTAPLAFGTLAAAAIIGALEVRRAFRQRERALGQCQPAATESADRLRTALRATQQADGIAALAATLRHVGSHCHQQGIRLPQLMSVRLGAAEISLDWAEPTSPPPFGFAGDQHRWTVPLSPALPECEHPCPYPALVSLGTSSTGEVLLVDAERAGLLGVAGTPDQQLSALIAMGVELACAPWSEDVRLVVIGPDAEVIALAGEDRVQVTDADTAMASVRRIAAQRRQALASSPLDVLRTDPNRAEAVSPFVFLFLGDVSTELAAELEQLLGGEAIGIAIIVGTQDHGPALWEIGGDADHLEGRLAGRPGAFAAHSIGPQTRADLSELLRETDPVRAPWWSGDNVYQLQRSEEEVNIVRLVEPAEHPRLLLIGPADLQGTTGPEPPRSRQQLIELCAWLLEHPGSNGSQMAAGMAIAESTRRSNLSRLRNWLGQDTEGFAYLPDAYSGRISLSSAVTSDWHQLQMLLAPGVERVADETLMTALELVRGAPLANAAPGQWYWAEELRTNIAAALRDVGFVLAERALRSANVDLARWAAARALVVAPEDELLLRVRLQTEYQAGNRSDTERLVNQLTRQARVLGVDLMPETIAVCQQVIEGRVRARA
jgi:nucleoid-associated protein YgaU